MFTRLTAAVVVMWSVTLFAPMRAHAADLPRGADSDEAPDGVADLANDEAPAVDDDRWMFRVAAAIAAPVGAVLGVGAFVALRIALMASSFALAGALGGQTARTVNELYQSSFILYALLPVFAGVGAGLLTLPFASPLGALINASVTAGLSGLLLLAGSAVGVAAGLIVGSGVGFAFAGTTGDPLIGFALVAAGGIIGGMIGLFSGVVVAGLGGFILTPAITGALVGKEPSWWDDAMGGASELGLAE